LPARTEIDVPYQLDTIAYLCNAQVDTIMRIQRSLLFPQGRDKNAALGSFVDKLRSDTLGRPAAADFSRLSTLLNKGRCRL